MKRVISAVVVLIGLAAPAWAGWAEAEAALERGDYETALREFRVLAEQGHVFAQVNLASMYSRGEGAPQDYAEAAKWRRKAADQGYDFAQNDLGNIYRKGLGVPQDYAEAVKWYRKSAEQGYAEAQHKLGVMYGEGQGVPQDYVQAHMWFNLAAAGLPPGEARDSAARNRDIVAKRMTPTQIAAAQRLAREWKPK